MPPEEIASYFTFSVKRFRNLPGDVPSRLSWIIGIQNFSGDNTGNVDDPTLPINPVDAPNTLIAIAGTEKIDRLAYKSFNVVLMRMPRLCKLKLTSSR